MLLIFSGNMAIAQTTTVDNTVIKNIMGDMAKKDSLIEMSEKIVYAQNKQIVDYKEIIKKLNENIKLNEDICKRNNLDVNARNLFLNKQIVDLRKNRNRWRITAIGIPVVLGGAATFLLLK